MTVRVPRALVRAACAILFLGAVAVPPAAAQVLTSAWSVSKVGSVQGTGTMPACLVTGGTSACGSFTIRSTGADIWSTADQFTFVSQTFTGDAAIVAKVSLQTAPTGAKAGIMFRESKAVGAKHGFVFISQG